MQAIAAASYALNQAKAAVPPAAAAVEEAVTETLSRVSGCGPHGGGACSGAHACNRQHQHAALPAHCLPSIPPLQLAAVKPVDAPAAAAPPTTPDPVLAQRAADADAEIAQVRRVVRVCTPADASAQFMRMVLSG
jgi:hypothetical protein